MQTIEVGLRLSLRLQLIGFRHENFSELISQALELERIELEETVKKGTEEKEKSGKTSGNASGSGSGKKKYFGGSNSYKSNRGRSSGQR